MVRPVTDDDIGLKVLHEAPRESDKIIDIIAIHGIGAHPDDAWCKNVGTAASPRWVNWLKKEDMLPAVAPNARIMRYGYQSHRFGERTMGQNVSTVAQQLLLALQRKREEDSLRPLIFIAHCFGGLVLLKTLLDAQHYESEWPGVLTSTIGLIFFGTPFRGAEGMSQVEMLAAAQLEYEDETHTDLLKMLDSGNRFLQQVVDQFGNTRREAKKAQVACFYELKPSSVGRIVGKTNLTRFIVGGSAGCLDLSDATIKYPLSRTHFDMNKFGDRTEEDFQTVGYVVRGMIWGSDRLIPVRSRRKYNGEHEIDINLRGLPMTISEGQHLDVMDQQVLPFTPVKHLGMGGSASVEMIRLTTDGQQFAHKIFSRFYGQKLDEIKRNFRNEVEVIKRLSPHPHIIRVYATYTCGRTLGMLLSPVADNGDLATYLQTISDSGNPPTAKQINVLQHSFKCLANGLAFIHKHAIRHKDIKPQNILIHDSRIIYTDFGIALDTSQKENTTTVGNPGAFTRRYCSPEVALWEKRNRKSDVFSLGCVFIDILAVLEPQNGLEGFGACLYWEVVNELRSVLSQEIITCSNWGPLFRVCHDMLEPTQEDRIDSQTLCKKMNLLSRPSLVPKRNCPCDDWASETEPQTSSDSTSPSIELQDGEIARERLALEPTHPSKNKRRRKRGKRSKNKSAEKIIEDGWGHRENFQASYGLGVGIVDLAEGNAILEAMMRMDRNNGNG